MNTCADKKIFLVSPVNTSNPENYDKVSKYVKELEKQQKKVFWPIRDNPYQKTDKIGIEICDKNLKELYEANEIHIYYLKESRGIHFDIGALYLIARIIGFRKKIIFVNKDDFYEEIYGENNGKSYIRILDFLEKQTESY